MERRSSKPRAIFMAFGTKGDVFPIAAIAAAFASDQPQHEVILITHSAHASLISHLQEHNVTCYAVSSPPVLSVSNGSSASELTGFSLSQKRQLFHKEHRRECLSIVERIFEVAPNTEQDMFVINFFALEGWNLAELFRVRCVVAAPYVMPYSVPTTFERRFKQEFPLLCSYFQKANADCVNWNDVLHWMWPLFTEDWGCWRRDCLNLSPIPFTDPVTCLPMWHLQANSTLLLYGFSKQIVECPGYWPSNFHVCGFWFLPMEWQFSCSKCAKLAAVSPLGATGLCLQHISVQNFVEESTLPVLFVGLGSIGSMGFLRNPMGFLLVLAALLESGEYHIILLTAGYGPLEAAIRAVLDQSRQQDEPQLNSCENGALLYNGRLLCFSGSLPYCWLLPKCAVAIHHGGSGTTAAALYAGIAQIACPFILDQFYWAERLHWLGVSPEPLQRNMLVPESNNPESIKEAVGGLRKAVKFALSPEVKVRAQELKETLSFEDGIREALTVLKEKIVNDRPT